MAKHYFKLSGILTKLLYNKHMNASALAREVNLPTPTVHRLVTGKSTRPYDSSLKPIADYFEITTDQLLGEAPLDGITEEIPVKQTLKIPPQVFMVPIVEWEDVKHLEKARKTTENFVPLLGKNREKCFALVLRDFSMGTLFPKNTVLIFDPDIKLTDRSLVLASVGKSNPPLFRQLLIDGEKYFAKALNPDVEAYKMRVLSGKEAVIATLFEARASYEVQ